jgi:hypothetical protein
VPREKRVGLSALPPSYSEKEHSGGHSAFPLKKREELKQKCLNPSHKKKARQ